LNGIATDNDMNIDMENGARFALSTNDCFRSLPSEAQQSLAQAARVQSVIRHETIVNRGDRPDGMYLVMAGEIKLLLVSAAGAERIVRLVRAGETFCEEAMLSGTEYVLAARANRNSQVVYIPRAAIQTVMARHTAFAEMLIKLLSRRMHELLIDMELCEQRSSAQRVAHYLVQHANHERGAIEVKLSSAKQVIASQLNMTPESFSRVLRRLKHDGFILPRGRYSIALTDISGLKSLAS